MDNSNYLSINQALWDHWATLHPESDFYQREAFLKHPMSLHSIELDLLQDLEGKRILHLQCHFGQDTLSLKTLGAAEVVGLDFSPVALEAARKLALECGIEASFVQADVLSPLPDLAASFDLVFASYGTLGWHPSTAAWMDAAFYYLKPGGKLVLVDFHPMLWTLDDAFEQIIYPYFNTAVIVENRAGSYASTEAKSMENHTWNHPISDILSPILEHPKRTLQHFGEYDYSPYALFEATQLPSGQYQRKGKEGLLPLVYSLVAEKSEN